MERRILKRLFLLAIVSLTFVLSCFSATATGAQSHSDALSNEDFWQWLSPQLELADIQHPSIDRWEQRYRRRHTELEIILQDGQDFLYPLTVAVRDRGMPLELALLPIIESHLNPAAVSSAGARGLWQILPSTAQHLGLKHDWWSDQSANYSSSTNAALDYLSYLHERFGGWLLSLAAYNAGEGRVWREMQNSRNAGRTIDLWDLELPAQTEVYVPKLLGLARVLRDPQGIKLPPIRTTRSFAHINIKQALDVVQIAQLAEISVEKVYRLNPHLLRWATPPAGPHQIYIPIEASQRFVQAAQNLPPQQRHSWQRHNVSKGETLGSIAQKLGVDVEALRKLNEIEKDRLSIGQTLIVTNNMATVDYATRQAVRARSRVSFAPRPLKAGYHRVAQGDSLWSIARSYGTSVARIRANNNLRPRARLMPGQLLQTGNRQSGQHMTYTVRKGDVLSIIAEQHGVTVAQIQAWNQLSGSLLKPGQKLQLQVPGH